MNFKRIVSSFMVAFSMSITTNAAAGQGPKVWSLERVLALVSPETLQAFDLHLPSYLPTVQEQLQYQATVPLHQSISVKLLQSSGGIPTLVTAKRWQHRQKSATQPQPAGGPILAIATTSGGEVRAFAICVDERAATAQIQVELPEDGQVAKIIFLSVVNGQRLELVGTGDLQKLDMNAAAPGITLSKSPTP